MRALLVKSIELVCCAVYWYVPMCCVICREISLALNISLGTFITFSPMHKFVEGARLFSSRVRYFGSFLFLCFLGELTSEAWGRFISVRLASIPYNMVTRTAVFCGGRWLGDTGALHRGRSVATHRWALITASLTASLNSKLISRCHSTC